MSELKDAVSRAVAGVEGALREVEYAAELHAKLTGPLPVVPGRLDRPAADRVIASLRDRGYELAYLHGLMWLLLLVKREERTDAGAVQERSAG